MSLTIRNIATLAFLGLAFLAAAGCQRDVVAQREVTVLMVEYKGEKAVEQANAMKQELTQKGLPDVFVVQGGGMASVCVGRFKAFTDPKAHETLVRVYHIQDANGQYPFTYTLLVPVPEPTPETSWALESANGYYTWHVATWEDTGRMAKAQAYAAQLRSEGFEAYVYQGPRYSMVTIGAFGAKIFDHPELVGVVDPPGWKGPPTPKPRIIDPKVVSLMQRFPHMRLEGEETPLPTQLVSIPGREAPYLDNSPRPKVLYRVTLVLVDTKTGKPAADPSPSGVVWFKDQIPTLVQTLAPQLLRPLPVDQVPRIGVAGVQPMDANASKEGVDTAALDALLKALPGAGRNIKLISPAETKPLLAASGRTLEDVMIDSRSVRGIQGLDFVVLGNVTSFAIQTQDAP
jgi:hypothetical protein